MKYVIGIDAGFTHTGVSIFKSVGGKLMYSSGDTFTTEKREKKKQVRVADDDADRIMKLILDLDKFLSENGCYDGDMYCVIELPSAGAQGARALRAMALITGAIVTFVTLKNIAVEYVTPNDVKIAVTGKKTASKDEIMDRIKKSMPNAEFPKTKDKFEHIADSIGAILHVRKYSQLYKIFVNK